MWMTEGHMNEIRQVSKNNKEVSTFIRNLKIMNGSINKTFD